MSEAVEAPMNYLRNVCVGC